MFSTAGRTPGLIIVALLGTAALAASCGYGTDSEQGAGTTAEPTPADRQTNRPTTPKQAGQPATPELVVPTPHLDPADFVQGIDNPFLPMVPGTRWVYLNTSSEGNERIVVHVTRQTKDIGGVTATVVRDTVTAEGKLIEDTWDWYAQDVSGNVWYLGEATKAYDEGTVSTEGSWQAGRDGAQAGIVMLADPRPGDRYYQEFYRGEAEDKGSVLSIDAHTTVPFGSYDHMVKTADFTALEPDVLEHKYYARGVGFVYEEKVKGGDDRARLVSMTRP